MATYLATVTSGRFRVTQSDVSGIPSYVAVDPREAGTGPGGLSRIADILALFGSAFGAYPFEATGAIVDHTSAVGYALETQTRPLFPSGSEHRAPRPRAGASVVRRRRDAETLAPDLAERGFRHVVVVVLGRERRRPHPAAALRAAVRDPGRIDRVLEPAARQPRQRRRSSSARRSTSGAR